MNFLHRIVAWALSPIRSLRSMLRARFQQWFESRLPFCDTHTLTQRNVYIVPTRAGWFLVLTLLVLLIASINYQLNLGYLLTFMLAGAAVIGMHVCHGNLRDLHLRLKPPAMQAVNSNILLEIELSSSKKTPRYGIGLRVLEAENWAWVDVPAQGQSRAHIGFHPTRRGRYRVPTLSAQTHYPLGTFRVWTVWRPASEVLVYPAPEVMPPPLPAMSAFADAARTRQMVHSNSGEFSGVRPYRAGDAMKQVVWKKWAKGGEMVSRDAQTAQHLELLLDYAQTGSHLGSGLGLEARLSRLSAWVLLAHQRDLRFGLRLPRVEIAPNQGQAHLQSCLEALALA